MQSYKVIIAKSVNEEVIVNLPKGNVEICIVSMYNPWEDYEKECGDEE